MNPGSKDSFQPNGTWHEFELTDNPGTYKPEVLCNIGMLRFVRTVSFPQLG